MTQSQTYDFYSFEIRGTVLRRWNYVSSLNEWQVLCNSKPNQISHFDIADEFCQATLWYSMYSLYYCSCHDSLLSG